MARIKLWRNNKSHDYKMIDRNIGEFFFISGTQVYIHRFVGFVDDKGNVKEDVKIQDLLFMETRDRKYDKNVMEAWGLYEVSDNDFELSQFGFFQSDTLYVDFHLNTLVQKMGRKLSAGDVLELTHLRDDALDGTEGAVNAYFVVEEGRRGADGYSPTWLPHVWRVRVRKIFDSREYNDVLANAAEENGDDGLLDILSTFSEQQKINSKVVEEAAEMVPHNEAHDGGIYDAALDGALPFDETLDLDDIHKMANFPVDAEDGDYVIRTDYSPHQLFRYVDGIWKIVDRKMLSEWTRGHDQTQAFVNNEEEFCTDGGKRTEKTYITNPLKPPMDD